MKTIRRFSYLSASDLIEFIEKVVGDSGMENYDVFSYLISMSIAVVNRNDYHGDEIRAAQIYYK